MTIPLINLDLYQNIQGESVQILRLARSAKKMTKLVNWFHFRSFKKFENTFHPYSMLFIYKQSYFDL